MSWLMGLLRVNYEICQFVLHLLDLIAAYKGVIKEKGALESSLKALSAVKRSDNGPKTTDGDTINTNSDNKSVSNDAQFNASLYTCSSL